MHNNRYLETVLNAQTRSSWCKSRVIGKPKQRRKLTWTRRECANSSTTSAINLSNPYSEEEGYEPGEDPLPSFLFKNLLQVQFHLRIIISLFYFPAVTSMQQFFFFFFFFNLSSSGRGQFGLLFTNEEQEEMLAYDKIHTSATHANLVHGVTNTKCQT